MLTNPLILVITLTLALGQLIAFLIKNETHDKHCANLWVVLITLMVVWDVFMIIAPSSFLENLSFTSFSELFTDHFV